MEQTTANIGSSSNVEENGFMSCFVSGKVNQTEETKLKKIERKKILQILRYDCSGGKMKLIMLIFFKFETCLNMLS